MGKVKTMKKPFRRSTNQEVTGKATKNHVIQRIAQTSKPISKKTKRAQKKSQFLEKLTTSNTDREKIEKSKKKSQTVIVGNMDPLLDALQDIDVSVINDQTSRRLKKIKTKQINRKKGSSEKSRLKSTNADIQLFQKVINNPKFKADPLSIIADHVKSLIGNNDT